MVIIPQILHDSNRFYAKAGSVLSHNIMQVSYDRTDIRHTYIPLLSIGSMLIKYLHRENPEVGLPL